MDRKALLISVMSCNLIVQSLPFTINISFKLIFCGMSEVTVFGTDVLDVLNIIRCQHFFSTFFDRLYTLCYLTLFISYCPIRCILFIR